MHTFLVVQAQYQNYEIGLFNNTTCVASHKQDKAQASKNLIPIIHELLEKNSLSIHDLDFIGVNKGPAPFTTLRIILTTINGIAFATSIPLISCTSLEALLHEAGDPQWHSYSVALLNAYNNDVYFAVHHPEKELWMGCMNIEAFLKTVKSNAEHAKVRFFGNGVPLFITTIQEIFGQQAILQEPFLLEASLNTIARITYDSFCQKKEMVKQVEPLYLKEVAYKTIAF